MKLLLLPFKILYYLIAWPFLLIGWLFGGGKVKCKRFNKKVSPKTAKRCDSFSPSMPSTGSPFEAARRQTSLSYSQTCKDCMHRK